MFHIFFLITTAFCCLISSSYASSTDEVAVLGAMTNSSSSIRWYTDYSQALTQAKAQNKPLFLFFGADWCGWCKKLKQQILDQPGFAKAVSDKLIFVNLDFSTPMEQNDKLRTQFGVSGFPTVILLDSQGNRLVNMGYMDVTPEEYANHVLQAVH